MNKYLSIYLSIYLYLYLSLSLYIYIYYVYIYIYILKGVKILPKHRQPPGNSTRRRQLASRRRSSFVVRRSSFVVRRSSFVVTPILKWTLTLHAQVCRFWSTLCLPEYLFLHEGRQHGTRRWCGKPCGLSLSVADRRKEPFRQTEGLSLGWWQGRG